MSVLLFGVVTNMWEVILLFSWITLAFDFIFRAVFAVKATVAFADVRSVCFSVNVKYVLDSLWTTNSQIPLHSLQTSQLPAKRRNVSLWSVIMSGKGTGKCFCKCLLCICLSAPGCRHKTGSGQAVVFGLPVHRFRLRCGVPPSCVCQRQFGLIYRPLTHSALDPTSAAGMAIPCVGGASTWVVLHWWGSDVVLLRSSGEHALQTVWRETAVRKCGLRPVFT